MGMAQFHKSTTGNRRERDCGLAGFPEPNGLPGGQSERGEPLGTPRFTSVFREEFDETGRLESGLPLAESWTVKVRFTRGPREERESGFQAEDSFSLRVFLSL
jgi:hypothetical protein